MHQKPPNLLSGSLLKGLSTANLKAAITLFSYIEISSLPVSDVNYFPLSCRIEAFNTLFGQHMRANRLDLISITDIEDVINRGAGSTYSSADILLLLEVHLLRCFLMDSFNITTVMSGNIK
jgi:hypothetical protein